MTGKGAGLPVWGILPKLRGEPERDGRGLKMKIWF